MQIQTQLKIQIQLKIQMPEHHEEKSEDTEPFFSALWRQKQLWHVVAVVVTIVVTVVVTIVVPIVVTVVVSVSVSDLLQVRSLLSLLNLFWNRQSSTASSLYFLDFVFPSDSTKTSSVLSKSQPSSFSEL